ncbi:unnamed protein product [Schistosoma intercalatum]|nr:unnamed protein product [Schistosoma intercalatum]CAH8480247.1 unnamed protein product [Schistosoma intercalatum]
MDQNVQITFYTKSKQYSVPSAPIAVPQHTTVEELNNLVKVLLDETRESRTYPEFTFLVDNLILTSTLHEYLSEKEVISETIDIEFCPKQEPPKYEREYVQDDLISCVKRCDKYILTGGYDGTLHIWSLDSKSAILSMELEEKVKCVEWISLVYSSAGRYCTSDCCYIPLISISISSIHYTKPSSGSELLTADSTKYMSEQLFSITPSSGSTVMGP